MAGLGFPFAVSAAGGIGLGPDADTDLHARIVQVLFTTPGERVTMPDFGCGLLDLVFEPLDDVLLAAVEFSAGQALTRWLGDDLLLDSVSVSAEVDLVSVEVAYRRRADLRPGAVVVTAG